MEIHSIVTDVLVEMKAKYRQEIDENKSWYNLTERDLVMYCYGLLSERLPDVRVHSELRPYRVESGELQTIQSIDNQEIWSKHKRNSGAKFDLCILDSNRDFFIDTKERSTANYWRFSMYPYEAFLVVIEFKIRVSGNLPRIEKDMKQLSAMCGKDSRCKGYLCVFDWKASETNLDIIGNRFKEERKKSQNIYYIDNKKHTLGFG